MSRFWHQPASIKLTCSCRRGDRMLDVEIELKGRFFLWRAERFQPPALTHEPPRFGATKRCSAAAFPGKSNFAASLCWPWLSCLAAI